MSVNIDNDEIRYRYTSHITQQFETDFTQKHSVWSFRNMQVHQSRHSHPVTEPWDERSDRHPHLG